MTVKIETRLTIEIGGAKWIITKEEAEKLHELLGEELKTKLKTKYDDLSFFNPSPNQITQR